MDYAQKRNEAIEAERDKLPLLKLWRLKETPVSTHGVLVGDKIFLNTLELPNHDNRQKESCIPANESRYLHFDELPFQTEPYYTVVPRTSKKYGHHFHVLNVPDRSFILFHTLNTYKQTLGCIGVGMGVGNVDNDGFLDITYSARAMNKLLKSYPNGFRLKIIDYV